MLAIFALACFLFMPGFFEPRRVGRPDLCATDTIDDQDVNLAQKNVNGILLVFPGCVRQMHSAIDPDRVDLIWHNAGLRHSAYAA
jgi:hypothetical protein